MKLRYFILLPILLSSIVGIGFTNFVTPFGVLDKFKQVEKTKVISDTNCVQAMLEEKFSQGKTQSLSGSILDEVSLNKTQQISGVDFQVLVFEEDLANLAYQKEEDFEALQNPYEVIIEGWALERRDKKTTEHSERGVEITLEMAKRLGFSNEECTYLRRDVRLHDIGKRDIPDRVLFLIKEE